MAALYHEARIVTKAALTRLNGLRNPLTADHGEIVLGTDFGGGDEVTFACEGRAGLITLCRPQALNALTHNMVHAISKALDAWERDDSVERVIIRAKGRAFSAGGDIQAIYRAGQAGEPLYDFFFDEYRLNARIESYPKPYVALIDGIVMGGGVGVSIHGSHRIFAENARFAMPEVTIGFFPDVGGSHFLSRLPGHIGLWLGLTGTRVGWGDALWCGLATHAVEAGDLDGLVADLCAESDTDAVLERYGQRPARTIDDDTMAAVDRHFSADSLGELVENLHSAAGKDEEFAGKTLAKLQKCSPTSLNVAFRQIRAGAPLSMRECMAMEYRIVNRMLRGHDFYEGIRAAVIDKDGAPKWQPASLAEIETAAIDDYFAGLGADELTFGTKTGEAASA